jgi:peroxiredoxin
VPPGDRLKEFAVPLAASSLNGDANLAPPCTEAHHYPRALNLCLLVHRGPVVLAFFSTSSKGCVQQVDAMQRVAAELPPGRVQFAAVAIRAGHRGTAALVRAHHWTIPVAYDRDGAVGSLYDVEICPLVELARTGGVVADRLIGNHWHSPSALAARVRSLLSG